MIYILVSNQICIPEARCRQLLPQTQKLILKWKARNMETCNKIYVLIMTIRISTISLEEKTNLLKFYQTKNQDIFTYLSQMESFGNRFGYFTVGCNIIFTQIIRETSKSVLNKVEM